MVLLDADDSALATRVVLYLHEVLHSPAANEMMVKVHALLRWCGVPPPYPDAERTAISLLTTIATLLLYFFLFGKRHRRRRNKLQEELAEATRKVQELEEKLAEMDDEEDGGRSGKKKEIRIWMDGAFDMMHYGHMNAFRQAKSLGTYLVVGVNDDKSITACKGAPPVMDDDERIASVAGCKFVDEVEPHCPYIMNEEYLTKMIKKHRLDYIVHGDDPCIVDGKDVYEVAQRLGKYRTIPRTEGVSTSDILGRMLILNKSHHNQSTGTQLSSKVKATAASTLQQRPSRFLTTNRMLRLFSVGNRDPAPNARVVYIDGAWDMFHPGHVDILKLAKAQGDYLIVGVHNDAIVNKHRGLNYPIMNLHERVLSVLGCRYVDDVLIDAPWQITKEMIASLRLATVVHGSHREMEDVSTEDPYKFAREAGIYKELPSPRTLDVKDIVDRINENRERFEKKFVKKMEAEKEYYDDRYAAKK
ncbi:ethanolamine-phosphate cytidylyltransferase [Achlya hypogyna]|uniref:ethanolamine-phosphate cytidylyltransferase n=1 Tax=Achlya hypogyna TaxID=1202772 RepID=A0A1V9Z8E0_ACHHY|nr:ethanolamine-phosphate cytidylyltransferase [Achlya hypogyna]